jgi:hypothetical protein
MKKLIVIFFVLFSVGTLNAQTGQSDSLAKSEIQIGLQWVSDALKSGDKQQACALLFWLAGKPYVQGSPKLREQIFDLGGRTCKAAGMFR